MTPTNKKENDMSEHKIETREDWLAAREQLLVREKEHMRQGDELALRRQELPWLPIEREYVFETDNGKKTLAELFDGRSQLLVYHFMFGFGFRVDEQNPGCTGCSFVDEHLPQREGMSAFAVKDGVVHHTYSTYDRGVEQLMGTYRMLDLAPLGRNEEAPSAWWRRHDEYETREEEARQ